jgi:hypothetical protein
LQSVDRRLGGRKIDDYDPVGLRGGPKFIQVALDTANRNGGRLSCKVAH